MAGFARSLEWTVPLALTRLETSRPGTLVRGDLPAETLESET